jgi:glycosyltransferase involved in cell wall biosynthesis
MKITYIFPENRDLWASIMWRCQMPVRVINRNGRYSAELVRFSEFVAKSHQAKHLCDRSDVVVLFDNLWGESLPVVQHWMARGKTFIADFDAAYQFLEPADQEYKIWTAGKLVSNEDNNLSAVKQFKWGLQMVSAATVPSQLLADDWKGYNRIEVIPNFIDLERYQYISPDSHEGINIGWNGGLGSLKSLEESGALEAVREVCRMRPKVKFIICSDGGGEINRLGLDENQTVVYPLKYGENWPKLLGLFDIGLAPLSGDFDQRRSWAPILEYLVTKTPWVASKGAAYRELKSLGWVVENEPIARIRILLVMVDHLEDYKNEAGQAAYLFGLSQSYDENIHQVISTYAKIMEYTQDKLYLSADGLSS